MRIMLVGGGRAAAIILNYFRIFDAHQITAVIDIREDAPGVLLAKKFGIPTGTSFEETLDPAKTDLVIELTGNEKTRQRLIQIIGDTNRILASGNAKLMCDLIDAQQQLKQRAVENLSEKFSSLRERIQHTIDQMDKSYERVDYLLSESKVISINANIEAARAGEAGRTFEVVANRFSELVKQIGETTDVITQAIKESQHNLNALHETEAHLKEVFQHSADAADPAPAPLLHQ